MSGSEPEQPEQPEQPSTAPLPEPPEGEDPPIATAADATKMAAAMGAALTFVALVLFGTRSAVSVAVGAGIAVGNLIAMRAIIRSLLPPADSEPTAKPSGAAAAWALFAVLKILLLFGGVWILLTRGMVDPMPLVVGYGVLPLGITASALFPPRKRRS